MKLNSYDIGYFITFVQHEYTQIGGEVYLEIVKQISFRFQSLKSKLCDKATMGAWFPYKGACLRILSTGLRVGSIQVEKDRKIIEKIQQGSSK